MATYYVATTGSDSNGGSSTQPFETIQHAANVVNPGDTVIVRDGVYSAASADELVVVTRSGTPDAPITFRAEHKWGAQLDGNNNAIATAVKFEGSSYVRFEDFDVYGFGAKSGGGQAFWIDGTSHNIYIGGNAIHDLGRMSTDTANASGVGVYAEGDSFTIQGNEFSNIGRFGPGENGAMPGNAYWQNHDHGIYLEGVTNVEIIDNTFLAHEHGWAIQVYGGSTSDLLIANNTFTGDNPNYAGQIMLSQKLSNVEISNNFFDQPLTAAIEDYAPNFSNVIIANNTTSAGAVYHGALPSGVKLSGNQVSADPLLAVPVTEWGAARLPLSPNDVSTAGNGATTGGPRSDVDVSSSLNEVSTTGNDAITSGPRNDLDVSSFSNQISTRTSIGNDVITGGRRSDHLFGNDGNDILRGGRGHDQLDGGRGNDALHGGRGKDVLFGGTDDDTMSGGSGNDILMGGSGSDKIDGGTGIDALLLSDGVSNYTVTVADNEVHFTNPAGATDLVSHVELFRFVGTGETYVIENGALTPTTDMAALDELISDQVIEELIEAEAGTSANFAAPAACGALAATPAATGAATADMAPYDDAAHTYDLLPG